MCWIYPQDAMMTLHIKAWEILGLNLHLKTLTGRDQIQVEQYWVSNFVTTFSVPPRTLPETNIAPENRPLEKEIPIGNRHFLGAMLVF